MERATEDVESFGEHTGNSRRYLIPYLRALEMLPQYRDEVDQAIG